MSERTEWVVGEPGVVKFDGRTVGGQACAVQRVTGVKRYCKHAHAHPADIQECALDMVKRLNLGTY